MIPLISTILSNLAVALLLAILATCIGRRSRHFAFAHVLWLAVLVKLITPPILGTPVPLPGYLMDPVVHLLPVGAQPANSSVQHAAVPGSVPHQIGVHASLTTAPSMDNMPVQEARVTIDWTAWDYIGLAALWSVVAAYLLFQGARRFVAFVRLVQKEARVDRAGTSIVQELLGPERRGPQVLLLPARVSPMLFGIGRWTYIVCPQGLWELLQPTQRRAFLAHEVAHFLRRDHWVRWGEWFVSSVYWWCPLTFFARRQLERFEELACDGWAVDRLGGKRRQYGETLLVVVDYLSSNSVATPRLSSRLHPNNLLEERLHQLQRHRPVRSRGKIGKLAGFAVCAIVLLIHPYPFRLAAARNWDAQPLVEREASQTPGWSPKMTEDTLPPPEEVELPSAPKGWWNESPTKRWASIHLAKGGTTLIAEAGQGVTLHSPDKPERHFSNETLSSLVLLPGAERIVIGDADGALRLWDVRDVTAVSLIGKHAAAITSLAYHPSAGLAAADAQGSVMLWNTASGVVLQTWTTRLGPVQSVRWSLDGKRLAVLLGTWASERSSRRWIELDGATLEIRRSMEVADGLAVVVDSEQAGWLGVSWSGTVYMLSPTGWLDGRQLIRIGHIPKDSVSSFVFSQDAGQEFGFPMLGEPKQPVGDLQGVP